MQGLKLQMEGLKKPGFTVLVVEEQQGRFFLPLLALIQNIFKRMREQKLESI